MARPSGALATAAGSKVAGGSTDSKAERAGSHGVAPSWRRSHGSKLAAVATAVAQKLAEVSHGSRLGR